MPLSTWSFDSIADINHSLVSMKSSGEAILEYLMAISFLCAWSSIFFACALIIAIFSCLAIGSLRSFFENIAEIHHESSKVNKIATCSRVLTSYPLRVVSVVAALVINRFAELVRIGIPVTEPSHHCSSLGAIHYRLAFSYLQSKPWNERSSLFIFRKSMTWICFFSVGDGMNGLCFFHGT